MLSFAPLLLLTLSSVLGGVSATTNCTKSSAQVQQAGTRKHRHEFGRPSSWKGHGGQSWSYSYSWSGSKAAVASGSGVHAVVEAAAESAPKAIRTVTAPVHTKTAKVTATKKVLTKKASSTRKATPKAVKSTRKPTQKTSAQGTARPTPSTTKKSATTTKKASSTVAATSTSTSTGISALQALALKSHNIAREEYGASALAWDNSLVSLAQTWADGCVWGHGGSKGAGQNLAMFSSKSSTVDQAVSMWMDEADDYDAANPIYSHFTQVVWQSTTKIGCAVSYCPSVQGLSYGGNLFVCNYLSAGNVPGQFTSNVGALISS